MCPIPFVNLTNKIIINEMLHSTPRGDRLVVVKVVTNQQDHLTTTTPLYVSTFKNNMMIFQSTNIKLIHVYGHNVHVPVYL